MFEAPMTPRFDKSFAHGMSVGGYFEVHKASTWEPAAPLCKTATIPGWAFSQ
jgi:hypothetical protein